MSLRIHNVLLVIVTLLSFPAYGTAEFRETISLDELTGIITDEVKYYEGHRIVRFNLDDNFYMIFNLMLKSKVKPRQVIKLAVEVALKAQAVVQDELHFKKVFLPQFKDRVRQTSINLSWDMSKANAMEFGRLHSDLDNQRRNLGASAAKVFCDLKTGFNKLITNKAATHQFALEALDLIDRFGLIYYEEFKNYDKLKLTPELRSFEC